MQPAQLWNESYINVITKERFIDIVTKSQKYQNFPPCSCGSGFQVAIMCQHEKCPFYKK